MHRAGPARVELSLTRLAHGSVALRQRITTHSSSTASRRIDTTRALRMLLTTTLTTHATRQRTITNPNKSQSAANVLPASEPPLEPGTITAPGSRIGTPAPLHDIEDTRKRNHAGRCSCAHTRPSALSIRHSLVRCHIATLPHATAPGRRADRAKICQRRNERRSDKAHHPKLARGHHNRQLW